MSFKISNAAYLFDSDGSTVLVAKNIKALDGKTSVNRTGALRTSLQGGYVNSVLQSFHQFQGTNAAYMAGGVPGRSTIEKYPFASDTNSTQVGSLTRAINQAVSSLASETHGYLTGGSVPGSADPATKNINYDITRYPFAGSAESGKVGELVALKAPGSSINMDTRAGSSSYTHGYANGTGLTPINASNEIQKFPFAIESGSSTIVGNLSVVRNMGTGQSSSTHGYTCTGYGPTASTVPGFNNIIDKYPFSADANATDVGDVHPTGYYNCAGISSTTDGFVCGGATTFFGFNPTNAFDYLRKFSFASDGNAVNVGSLTNYRYYVTGSSSTTHGYINGGRGQTPSSPDAYVNEIVKFPYSISSGTVTDVGDLIATNGGTASTQD